MNIGNLHALDKEVSVGDLNKSHNIYSTLKFLYEIEVFIVTEGA